MRLIFSNGMPFAVSSVDQFFSLFFSCEVNIASDMWVIEMHNHRLFWMFSMNCQACVFDCNVQKRCSNSLYSFCSFFTSHIVKVHTFFYKIGQSRDTLTADKTCMQTRKDRREYMWNCSKRGDHPGNNASTYCFACSSNASDTRIWTNRNKFIHRRSDFI